MHGMIPRILENMMTIRRCYQMSRQLHNSSASNSFENSLMEIRANLNEDKIWSQSKEASLIGQGLEPNDIINAKDMKDYIRYYQFFVLLLLLLHYYYYYYCSQRGYGNALQSPPAFRFLSALLTFPLTLAYALNSITDNTSTSKKKKVLVLGARSESSLPFFWWKVSILPLSLLSLLSS